MSVSSTLREQVGRNSDGVSVTGFHGNPPGNPPAPKQSQAHACSRPIFAWKATFVGTGRFGQPNSLAKAFITRSCTSPAEHGADLAMIPAGGVPCGHPL
ncbi:conserved hypothetical protein [Ricinus communis]|uniref:Uncharacterized protein n=1 Tax=Ricinus communis TaxID=3988 RepID=B9TM41_RICCO|nr:conserved hypothetical protein [Ricinus communis]